MRKKYFGLWGERKIDPRQPTSIMHETEACPTGRPAPIPDSFVYSDKEMRRTDEVIKMFAQEDGTAIGEVIQTR